MVQTVTAKIARRIPRGLTGRFMGALAATRASRAAVRPFARVFGVDAAEAEHDIGEYRSLSAFFVRRLRPGARPIDGTAGALVSPVDGVLSECGRATEGTAFVVKGEPLGLDDLLGPARAAPFRGGGYSVHYLHPRDYHWIHAPHEGRVTAWAHIPGDHYPVFPRALDEFGCVFTRNERVITFMETPLGRIAVAKVAAMGVGNVTLAYADVPRGGRAIASHVELAAPIDVARGDPLGTFHLGSTVVVAWEDHAVAPIPGLAGRHLKMGEPFASRR